MRDRVDQSKTMLNLQVTFSFIHHQAIKKICDDQTEKKRPCAGSSRSENSFFVLCVALSLEQSVNFKSDILVYSSPYGGKDMAILKRVREIGPSHESAFHLIRDLPVDKDAAF